MQITLSQVYEIPDTHHIPKHNLDEFLEYKAGKIDKISKSNPLWHLSNIEPIRHLFTINDGMVFVNPEKAFRTIEKVLGVSKAKIRSRSRKRDIVIARHIYSYMLKKYTSLTLKDIAKSLGGRHHTSIINSIKIIEGFLYINDPIVSVINKVKKELEKEE